MQKRWTKVNCECLLREAIKKKFTSRKLVFYNKNVC